MAAFTTFVGSRLRAGYYPADPSNYTRGRTDEISKIIVHHMAGRNTAKGCGEVFATPGRNGSAHYGIGYDGEIGQYISEADTAWDSPQYKTGVSIETSNDETGGEWHVSDASLLSLIRLIADIADRHGLFPLTVGVNLAYHSMYAATVCPGDYLRSKMQYIADSANELIVLRRSAACDNTPADWAAEAVDWAVVNGIMRGDEKGNLRLRDAVTREEMCVMMKRGCAAKEG